MTYLSFQTIENLTKRHSIEDEQAQIFHHQLSTLPIKKILIRNILFQSGKNVNKVFYILEGSVNLVARLPNHEYLQVCQVNRDQIVNLDASINKWISKFTAIVASSHLKFVEIDRQIAELMAKNILEQLRVIMIYREGIVNSKLIDIEINQKVKQKEKMILKMKLPSLKNFKIEDLDNKNQIVKDAKDKIEFNFPEFSKKPFSKNNKGSFNSKSLQKLAYQNNPQSLHEQQLKKNNEYILEKYRDNQARLFKSKMSRIKEEKSVSLQIRKNQHSPDQDTRHQKIFKEQLRSIIKRKLVFQRKHFKVLKGIGNNNKKKVNQIEIIHHVDNEENNIDNYFLM